MQEEINEEEENEHIYYSTYREELDRLEEDDEISPAERGFMDGYLEEEE